MNVACWMLNIQHNKIWCTIKITVLCSPAAVFVHKRREKGEVCFFGTAVEGEIDQPTSSLKKKNKWTSLRGTKNLSNFSIWMQMGWCLHFMIFHNENSPGGRLPCVKASFERKQLQKATDFRETIESGKVRSRSYCWCVPKVTYSRNY